MFNHHLKVGNVSRHFNHGISFAKGDKQWTQLRNICNSKHAVNSSANVRWDLAVQPLPHCCRVVLSVLSNSRQERELAGCRNYRTSHQKQNGQSTYLCQARHHKWTCLTINRKWENGLIKTCRKRYEWDNGSRQ